MTSDSVIVSKLLQLKSQLAAATFETKLRQLTYALKYDPNQPRVPAGSPEGGQWASGNDSGNENDDPLASFAVAARRGQSEEYCWNQLTIDNLLCATLSPPWRIAVCRGQAMERYGACLAGRPIPPLSY